MNYYRNMDRNWETTPQLDGAKIKVPVAFLAGVDDIVIRGAKEPALRAQMPAGEARDGFRRQYER